MITIRKTSCTGGLYQCPRTGAISNVRMNISSLNELMIPQEYLEQQGLALNEPCDIVLVGDNTFKISPFSSSINDNTESCIKDSDELRRKKWATVKEIVKTLISPNQTEFVRTIDQFGCIELPLKLTRKLRIRAGVSLFIETCGDSISVKKIPKKDKNLMKSNAFVFKPLPIKEQV